MFLDRFRFTSVSSGDDEKKEENKEPNWNKTLRFLFITCGVFFIVSVVILFTNNYVYTSKANTANMAFDMLGMTVAIILLASTRKNKAEIDEFSALFCFTLGIVSIGFFFDFVLCVADGNPGMYIFASIGRFLYFALSYLTFEIFWDFLTIYLDVKTTKFTKTLSVFSNIIWVIMTVVVFLNYIFGFMYTTNAANQLIRGPYYALVFLYPFFISIISIVNTSISSINKANKLPLYLTFSLDFILLIAQLYLEDLHLLYIATFISIIVIYSNIFADRAKQLKQKELELTNQRFAVMISQIQPHFLYNSLSTIRYLIRKDPVTAEQAVIKFSDYLRTNLDSLKKSDMIPLQKELDHVDNYLFLEKLRFEDTLNIEYELECEDFDVPAISIQPLVENAVKHGIQAKEGGGTVMISTKEYEEYFEITVSDNGTGFDMEAIKHDGKNHIGMENVRQRIKKICNGTLSVTSVPGQGTVSVIRIPR